MALPSFLPLSESSLLMRVGDRIDLALTRRIASFSEAMRSAEIPGVVEYVPSYISICIIYDPAVTSFAHIQEYLSRLWNETSSENNAGSASTVTIPVIYGDEFGDDLEEVSGRHNMSPEEVIERHKAGQYTVAALGFSPGFSYLLGLDPALATPRKTQPRTRIPAGSVGIGGEQTGMYALTSPGGWNLIGRTPMTLFDPASDDPLALRLGDVVRFEQVALPEAPPSSSYTEFLSPAQIDILTPGLQTTVQDLGRLGYGRMGFAPNGAADRASLLAANRLVGNPDDAAGLEITLTGPTMRFRRRTTIALTGADGNALLNGLLLPVGRVQGVMPGDELVVRAITGPGVRTYLGVAGGIDVPMVMGSRSTDITAGLGGYQGRALRKGDSLPIGSTRRSYPANPIERTVLDTSLPFTVMPGPESSRFPDDVWQTFLSSTFTVAADSNRMGIRLDGPVILPSDSADIISEGLVTGSIQVTGAGQPIVMLPGHATIGGYTRIATVIDADLDRLGQLRPGDSIRFTSRYRTS